MKKRLEQILSDEKEKIMMEKVGLTIGKFAPLHKGHQALIEKAIKEMDQLIVVVYDTTTIDIPTKQRADWIRKLYPSVIVLEANNPPMQYGLDQESVAIQMHYLEKIIAPYQARITHFYSNEPYGEKVAEYMNIENRNTDIKKKIWPINSTMLRKHIEENKQWIDETIYQCIQKKENKK